MTCIAKGRSFHFKETEELCSYFKGMTIMQFFHFKIPILKCSPCLNISNIHKHFLFKTGLNFGNSQKSMMIWHTELAIKRVIFHWDENVNFLAIADKPGPSVLWMSWAHFRSLCVCTLSCLLPELPIQFDLLFTIPNYLSKYSLTFSSQKWLSFFCGQTTFSFIMWYLSHPILNISVCVPSSASGFQTVWE